MPTYQWARMTAGFPQQTWWGLSRRRINYALRYVAKSNQLPRNWQSPNVVVTVVLDADRGGGERLFGGAIRMRR